MHANKRYEGPCHYWGWAHNHVLYLDLRGFREDASGTKWRVQSCTLVGSRVHTEGVEHGKAGREGIPREGIPTEYVGII